MTRPAGRELDAEVAEKVMGIHVGKVLRSVNVRDLPKVNQEFQAIGIPACCVPNYSTSIADAWSVVERLTNAGWLIHLWIPYEMKLTYRCEFTYDWAGEEDHARSVCMSADTAPLAICLAALKVKEEKHG